MLTQDDSIRSKIPWTEVVEAKRAIRTKHIEKHQRKIEDSEIYAKVTGIADISSLTQLLESNEVSAEDIVTAYIQKCV